MLPSKPWLLRIQEVLVSLNLAWILVWHERTRSKRDSSLAHYLHTHIRLIEPPTVMEQVCWSVIVGASIFLLFWLLSHFESLLRLGNETTSLLPAGSPKCSAKASGSGWLANSGLSSRTNSNGRTADAVVIGGVSQRKAENGASADSAIKNPRKTGSSSQRRKTSVNFTGRFSKSTLTALDAPILQF